MLFKNIPVNSVILLGTPGWRGASPYVWLKNDDGTLISSQNVGYGSYNRYDQDTNFYPETDIHRWLNDPGGLLSRFTEEERNVLVPQHIVCEPPKHRRKEGVQKIECLACLPSITQILHTPEKYPGLPHEGKSFRRFSRYTIASRTSCGEKSFYESTQSGDYYQRIGMHKHFNVYAVIKIDPEACFNVEDDGYYHLSASFSPLNNEALSSVLFGF